MLHLLNGDFRESLRANALAIPLLVMLAATLLIGGWHISARRDIIMSARSFRIWLCLLLVAWVMKLLGSPEYW